SYTEGDGFKGSGKAEVKTERVEVLTLGAGYALHIEKGTGAEVTVDKSELTKVGGTINLMLTDGGNDFIKAKVTADYDVKANNFSGTGEAEVLCEKQLAEAMSIKLFLDKGSGATVTVENNDLKKVSGTINVRLDDNDGTFAKIELEGGFDATAGTFSGRGSVEVTRDKSLGTVGNYEFFLTPGSGANIVVTDNKIEEVGGTINFKLMDGQAEPLIRGEATGKYVAATGKFSGNGGIYLGRDIEFDLGSGTKIIFKKDSGGNGEVKDNKLEKLGGTLKAELHKDGPLVSIEASGEYDAVQNKLLWAEGSAKLLRNLELFDGKVIVSKLEGTARIENNKLVRAGGSCAVQVVGFEGATIAGGVDDFLWQNTGGTDEYTGKGWLQVDVGEKISGRLDFELLGGGKFKVSGSVTYKMVDEPEIKGTIGFEMDEKLDPKLSGTLEVNNVELVPGRDILKFGMNVPMSIPVFPGINVALGIDMGLALDMQPLTFSVSIGVKEFFPLRMNMPEFTAKLSLSTGLTFKAFLGPYLGVSVGVAGVEAGLRLKGLVELAVPITLTPYGLIRGSEAGFSGELGVGLTIAPSVTLALEPQAFAAAGGKTFEYSFTRWEHQFPDLFKFEWKGTYKFGAESGKTESSPSSQEAAPAGQSDTSQHRESSEGAGGDYEGGQGGSSPGGPQIEDPDQLKSGAPSSAGGAGGGGGMADLMAKVDEAGKIAQKVGGVANLFKTIMDMIMIGTLLGPVGIAAYLGYRCLIKQDLTLSGIIQSFTDMIDLCSQLMSYGLDLLQQFLPEWVMETFNRIKDMTIEELFKWFKDQVKAAIGDTWFRVAEPLIDFFQSRATELRDIFEVLFGGGATLAQTVGALLKLYGFAATSVVDLAKAVFRMGQIVIDIWSTAIDEGYVYINRTESGHWYEADTYDYQVHVPGAAGPWTGGSMVIAKGLHTFGSVPYTWQDTGSSKLGAAETAHVAARGTKNAAGGFPHSGTIQSSFEHHDISGLQSAVGLPETKMAGQDMGANAWISDGKAGFVSSPDLHTAAHEAAHG
ncbi:MAG: hypothetical protein KKI08_01285, partial [Armatimonadetes bacterium]|nr:hypothetical protein [Armatimonadota bacterium]